MDDALLVRRLERLRDLLRDRQRFAEWYRSARNPLRELLAIDQFHDDERRRVLPIPPVLPVQPIDLRDNSDG